MACIELLFFGEVLFIYHVCHPFYFFSPQLINVYNEPNGKGEKSSFSVMDYLLLIIVSYFNFVVRFSIDVIFF